MILKKILFILLMICLQRATAQQRPIYAQYVLNNFLINPSLAGIEDYFETKMGFRNQWVGLDGAPVTTYVSIQGPIKALSDYRQSSMGFSPPGQLSRDNAYWRSFQKADPHIGVGLTVVSDKIGPISTLQAAASVAYHLPLSDRLNLSGGLSGGVYSLGLDRSKINFNVAYDPIFNNTSLYQKYFPLVDAGIWIHSANFYTGFSVQQLLSSNYSFTESKYTSQLVSKYIFTTGYRFFLTDEIDFLPSTLIWYEKSFGYGADANFKFQYKNLVWLTASYRYQVGYAGTIGLNVSNKFNISYGYDLSSDLISSINLPSHELTVGFLIWKNEASYSSKSFW